MPAVSPASLDKTSEFMPAKQAVSLALSPASLTDFKIFKIILKGVRHSLK